MSGWIAEKKSSDADDHQPTVVGGRRRLKSSTVVLGASKMSQLEQGKMDSLDRRVLPQTVDRDRIPERTAEINIVDVCPPSPIARTPTKGTPESILRQSTQRLSALVNSSSKSSDDIILSPPRKITTSAAGTPDSSQRRRCGSVPPHLRSPPPSAHQTENCSLSSTPKDTPTHPVDVSMSASLFNKIRNNIAERKSVAGISPRSESRTPIDTSVRSRSPMITPRSSVSKLEKRPRAYIELEIRGANNLSAARKVFALPTILIMVVNVLLLRISR